MTTALQTAWSWYSQIPQIPTLFGYDPSAVTTITTDVSHDSAAVQLATISPANHDSFQSTHNLASMPPHTHQESLGSYETVQTTSPIGLFTPSDDIPTVSPVHLRPPGMVYDPLNLPRNPSPATSAAASAPLCSDQQTSGDLTTVDNPSDTAYAQDATMYYQRNEDTHTDTKKSSKDCLDATCMVCEGIGKCLAPVGRCLCAVAECLG